VTEKKRGASVLVHAPARRADHRSELALGELRPQSHAVRDALAVVLGELDERLLGEPRRHVERLARSAEQGRLVDRLAAWRCGVRRAGRSGPDILGASALVPDQAPLVGCAAPRSEKS
jgi:hypothetical protein